MIVILEDYNLHALGARENADSVPSLRGVHILLLWAIQMTPRETFAAQMVLLLSPLLIHLSISLRRRFGLMNHFSNRHVDRNLQQQIDQNEISSQEAIPAASTGNHAIGIATPRMDDCGAGNYHCFASSGRTSRADIK